MSRTIQLGDLALISVGGQQFSSPITSIDSSGIHASQYTIIPLNNQWQVQGYHLPHTVTFYQVTREINYPFTDVYDINKEILLGLDYQTLGRACRANASINTICEDDRFWREKVRRDFGVEKYKPEEITYQRQYRELVKATNYVPAIKDNRLDILIALEKKGIALSREEDYLIDHVNRAAGEGHLQVLEWLAVRNILPTKRGVDYAAENGYLQVLEWLATRNILPTRAGAVMAAENGHLEVLKWLATMNILPTQYGANLAVRNGHLEVLKWLATRDILPTRTGANLAAMNSHLQVLEWLVARNILPTQEGVDFAAEKGQLEVLKWLAVRNILPTQRGADWAAMNGHLEVLEWLVARNILPTQEGANGLQEMDIFKFLNC